MTREAISQIEEYVNLQEENLERLHWKRAKRIPEPQCFKWLVQWQILGKTKTQIRDQADSDGLDAKTITRGINRAAKAVYGHNWELWLRPGKTGRPRNEPS